MNLSAQHLIPPFCSIEIMKIVLLSHKTQCHESALGRTLLIALGQRRLFIQSPRSTHSCAETEGGHWGPDPPPENHKDIGFLSNSGPEPWKIWKITNCAPALNNGPSLARQLLEVPATSGASSEHSLMHESRRGRQGVRTPPPPPPLENHKNIGFLTVLAPGKIMNQHHWHASVTLF